MSPRFTEQFASACRNSDVSYDPDTSGGAHQLSNNKLAEGAVPSYAGMPQPVATRGNDFKTSKQANLCH